MMHDFLANNADDLIKRCVAKVAKRPRRQATETQLRNGIPMFLSQLTRILETEQEHGAGAGDTISGASGGNDAALSEMKTGLGLGLSIARQSIAADDGQITVENFPGIGCAFTISLPRHAAP